MEARNKMIRAKANIWLLETVWASEEELHPGRPGLSPGEGLERQAGPRQGPGRAASGLGGAKAPCECRGQRAKSPCMWGRAPWKEARAPAPAPRVSTESQAAGT